MPELAERLVALTARVTGLGPLLVVGASRALFAGLICIVLWSLARGLGMEPRLAALAAILPPLAPTISWMASINSRTIGFLRYFRAVSPAFYVLLLLLALRLVLLAWKKPLWWTGLLAGASLGLLIYVTPIYFWSFAIAGVAWLAVQDSGKVRAAMVTSFVIALILGLPHFWRAFLQDRVPDVRETLARLDLLVPGRSPDEGVTRTLVIAVALSIAVWLWRRRLGQPARFLFPFMCVGTLLMVQNVVTNRHLQGDHWIECLIPIWSLAGVAFLQSSTQSFRPAFVMALVAVLVAGAMLTQVMAYEQWEESREEDAEFWALEARMPRTLNWLNDHTPANSVVIAGPDVMDSLPMFTHNKVYWADYASQHVMPEWEVQARTQSLESWHPDGGSPAPIPRRFLPRHRAGLSQPEGQTVSLPRPARGYLCGLGFEIALARPGSKLGRAGARQMPDRAKIYRPVWLRFGHFFPVIGSTVPTQHGSCCLPDWRTSGIPAGCKSPASRDFPAACWK